jgi:Mg2+/Co2+ transporter CorC
VGARCSRQQYEKQGRSHHVAGIEHIHDLSDESWRVWSNVFFILVHAWINLASRTEDLQKVIDSSRRRVLKKETVKSTEKVLSISDESVACIVKPRNLSWECV